MPAYCALFGMAQGHWDIREEDINKPPFVHDRKRGVNYNVPLPRWRPARSRIRGLAAASKVKCVNRDAGRSSRIAT
jgi:hypothetical protein